MPAPVSGPLAQVGADSQAPAPLPPPAPAALAQPRSPYWPNPAGKADCFSPYNIAPLPALCGPNVDTRELVWGNADYLLLWTRSGSNGSPLVTTGTATSLGVLGVPGTATVFGGSGLDFRAYSGAEFGLGFWFNRDRNIGLEGNGFFTEDRTLSFTANSGATGAPLFARPLVNALASPPFETSQLISAPGTFSGNIGINADSEIYGFDINFVARYGNWNNWNIDFLAGFRFLELEENLNIAQFSNILPGGAAGFLGVGLPVGSEVSIYDHFAGLNRFYGGQVGVRGEYCWGATYVRLLGKLALGDSNENVNVEGLTTATPPGGATVRTAGGLLALSTNSGRINHDEFAVVPELGLTLGYAITPQLKVSVGYTFLYWSDVARPGDQVNRVVNPALIPTSTIFGTTGGLAQPAPTFNHTDFWAQGLTFGVELRY
jgi:hypothetical protein